MPGLVKACRNARGKDVDVLLVSYDLQVPKADRASVVSRVRKFVERREWGFPVAIFDAADLDAINDRFDLPGPIPVTLVFDENGREVDREEGETEEERFVELVQSALGT